MAGGRKLRLTTGIGIDDDILAGSNASKNLCDARCQGKEKRPTVRGQLDDGDVAAVYILLIAHVFVREDEHVKGLLGETEQLAVENTSPAEALDGGQFVPGQKAHQWMRDVFVEQDSHAASRSNC